MEDDGSHDDCPVTAGGGELEETAEDPGESGGETIGVETGEAGGTSGGMETGGEARTTTGQSETGDATTGTTGGDESGESGEGSSGSVDATKRVFVTTESFDGADMSGADQHCGFIAELAGLDGQWVAWVSWSDVPAIDKLTPDAGPYLLLGGTLIASDNADLSDGMLAAPIDVDEDGNTIDEARYVWTGTTADGTTSPHQCLDGLNGTSSFLGAIGYTGAADGLWSDLYWGECDTAAAFYCFER